MDIFVWLSMISQPDIGGKTRMIHIMHGYLKI